LTAEYALFFVFSICTVGSAAIVVITRNAVGAAMALVATFFFLAGLYVLLLAPTIAVLQVLVYAGAIMVLFLFVIMLLALDVAEGKRRPTGWQVLGGLAAAGLGSVLLLALWSDKNNLGFVHRAPADFGSIGALGRAVYTTYLFPFEAVSLLLLIAIVGAVVVAKARI
jgi:NADH-quinone oxidoreductase subunit J